MFRIKIDLDDCDMERKLARRLAELSGNLDIVNGNKELDDEFDLVINADNYREFIPVSRGLSIIAGTYSAKTGKPLYKPKKGFRKHYRFMSPTGGSGLSSIALVFARHIAGKTGDKVLMIDIGRRDSFLYGESDGKPVKSTKELSFRAKSGQKIVLSDYLMRDHFGIDILTAEYQDDRIMEILEMNGNYDTVVSAGATSEKNSDGMDITVINVRDARVCDFEIGSGILVRNRDYINNVSDDRVLIADDSLSFKNPSGRVTIAMDGDFAYGVEKLMRKAVNEYEYV